MSPIYGLIHKILVLNALAVTAGAASGWAAGVARIEHRVLELSDARKVRAEIRIPKSDSPLPAVLVFGGFRSAARVLDVLAPGLAADAGDVPVILASFDYPFDPPRKLEFPGSLRYVPELKNSLKWTTEGIHQLVAVLASMPEVDAGRVSVLGASFGSLFAVQAASANPAIQGVILVHGFGDPRSNAYYLARKKFVPRYGEILGTPLAWLLSYGGLSYLAPPDPAFHARGLKRHQSVLLVSAEDDDFIPRSSSDALWEGLRGSEAAHERIWMTGKHVQPGHTALIAEILSSVKAWMGRRGLLTSVQRLPSGR